MLLCTLFSRADECLNTCFYIENEMQRAVGTNFLAAKGEELIHEEI